MTIHRRAVPPFVALLLLLCPQANAEAGFSKTQCIEANGNAQSLRREGKLAQAREQLRMCSDPKCPSLVATDCTKRLDELESVQPTIVFEVKDSAGRDLSVVTLTMDGAPFAEKLDGTALLLDPGEHEVMFTMAGVAPVRRRFVMREGERGRRERIVVATPSSPPASTSGPSPTEASPSTSSLSLQGGSGTQKVLGASLGGLGVVGLAVGAVFGMMTKGDSDRQKSACATSSSCSDYSTAASYHADAQRNGTISTVTFIAGAALLTGGVVLFLTAKPASERAARNERLAFEVRSGPSAAALLLRGSF